MNICKLQLIRKRYCWCSFASLSMKKSENQKLRPASTCCLCSEMTLGMKKMHRAPDAIPAASWWSTPWCNLTQVITSLDVCKQWYITSLDVCKQWAISIRQPEIHCVNVSFPKPVPNIQTVFVNTDGQEGCSQTLSFLLQKQLSESCPEVSSWRLISKLAGMWSKRQAK